MRVPVTVMLIATLAASAASGQVVHRCVDSSGSISFSDRPCPVSAEASTITVTPNVLETEGEREVHRQFEARERRQAWEEEQRRLQAEARRQHPAASDASLEHQRRAEAMLEEAAKISERAARTNNTMERSGLLRQARGLRESAAILMGSSGAAGSAQQLERGREMLEEAAKISERAARTNNAMERSGLLRQSRGLRESAAVLLGAPIPDSPVSGSGSAPIPAPHQPSIITNCDAGGCWDNLGGRYTRGAGTTYFRSSGGTCQLIGNMMQCP